MASYLERYLAGERERVWDELVALGAAVREEPVYADALAVARETMRRARANVETLIPRLIELGYVLGYDYRLNAELCSPFDANRWEHYERLRRWARRQPPIFLPPHNGRAEPQGALALDLENIDEDDAAIPGVGAAVDEFDRTAGPLPIALRVWYEEVGAVNLFGYHPGWVPYLKRYGSGVDLPDFYLMEMCEPLQVWPLGGRQRERILRERANGAGSRFEFAPDSAFKNGTGGSSTPFGVTVPNPGIDGMLDSYDPPMTFVQYLRTCFHWGGFPGWERIEARPEQDLAFLTEGLLPL